MCDLQATASTETHIAHENLLRGSEVSLDLTVRRVDDSNAIIREDVEHVSHTEAWKGQAKHGHTPLAAGPLAGSQATWGTQDTVVWHN